MLGEPIISISLRFFLKRRKVKFLKLFWNKKNTFFGISKREYLVSIGRGILEKEWSEFWNCEGGFCYKLIENICQEDPEHRLSLTQICRDKWVSKRYDYHQNSTQVVFSLASTN
jgi:hypothetical protein